MIFEDALVFLFILLLAGFVLKACWDTSMDIFAMVYRAAGNNGCVVVATLLVVGTLWLIIHTIQPPILLDEFLILLGVGVLMEVYKAIFTPRK